MISKNYSYLIILFVLVSCKQYIKRDQTNYEYHDINISDTLTNDPLLAVTNEEYLQYGSNVAFVNILGDTIIPFGNFAYFGTDTLNYFANVLEHPNDSTYGRWVGIDRYQNILFDLVSYDNGPDYFNEGLVRVKRNGRMGYANRKGEIVIPCQYAFAGSFHNGVAKVTFEARDYKDMDDHPRVESDSWFTIDKQGNKVEVE